MTQLDGDIVEIFRGEALERIDQIVTTLLALEAGTAPPDAIDYLEKATAVAPDDAHFRFCFHWPDEEPELMEVDLASYQPYTDVVRGDAATPWGSATIPACAITMMTPGSVAAEAAAITVPVLVACGERDVVPDAWAEPAAYRGTRNITVRVIPRMAHMHNFAQTRDELWTAIERFTRGVDQRVPAYSS